MFETAIIVFREVLEAAIVIGIMAAATQAIPNKNKWLLSGIFLGLLGAVLVALLGNQLGELADGLGQELFNASVVGIAVVMLAWQTIWMSTQGASISNDAKKTGMAIKEGQKALSVLLVIVGLAILREGSEVVVFLYGISASGAQANSMLLGGGIGILSGMLVGFIIYTGLLHLPIGLFFKGTAILIAFLSAGMASQAANYLVQANKIPVLASPLWDLSSVLPNASILGSFLQTLLGYNARPDGIQVVFYVVTLLTIFFAIKWLNYRSKRLIRKDAML
ncbi:FTR1 family iron permease [Hydrogenovibrio thermophilus]|uniref:Iron permease n=2 Tax=Hydrogenovibrio TaxID=28884 RepID=A0A410H5N3_9GAMM|nr:FTR1 family protein [Hydrogenovibrio thermophilus]QAB16244.1 iron permease [Hydrogenovibrio thermophilus]RUM93075.1 MAG: iron permease [Thiomicrospira sp.]